MSASDYARLLMPEPASDVCAAALLEPVGFADGQAARRIFQRMALTLQAREALQECLPRLLTALANTASPDRALINLERLTASVADPCGLCQALTDEPRLMDTVVTLLAGSQFLSEILLRYPAYLDQLRAPRLLAQPKAAEQFDHELAAALAREATSDFAARLDALRRWQRAELLRLGICDLLGLLDLPTVTAQLAHLADSLVRASLALAAEETHTPVEGLAVFALGKLGGEELNYSSDLDLLFIATSDAATYTRLGERLIDALAQTTAEGFLYRVDMQLRPWGKVGSLIPSREGYLSYLRRHARVWEKQALLKARCIAGNRAVGEDLLRQVAPFVYGLDLRALRADVRAMKRRIEDDLRRNGREWGEVKLGRGSIRDVEFVVQYLQLTYGAQHPSVRSHNTLDALARLVAAELLTPDEYRVLTDGYTFLRPVEHLLQMMDYRQMHSLPHEAREITYLARRLGFQGAEAGAQFLTRYQQHSAAIRAVFQRYLEEETPMALNAQVPAPDVHRHLQRMVPSYEAVFSPAEIRRHAALAEQLDAETLVEVDPLLLGSGDWRVTLVGYDYPGELSLICGLLFAYGFSIRDGHVFTYEPVSAGTRPLAREDARRKIVDVFTVHAVRSEVSADVWQHYARDLTALLRRLQAGELNEAQGELATRVALSLANLESATTPLYPIDVEIDNETSDRYTVLHIEAPDTLGFLYEFTNALALNGVYIAQVTVETLGNRVHDTLYVTDGRGNKIMAPARQRELRAAVVLVKHFTHLLPHSPNPESALLHFREFLGQLFARPDWPNDLASLRRPEVLEALARLLGVSDFLWEDFLRMQHANLFPVVRDVDALATARSKAQLQAEVEAALAAAPDPEARRGALNAFKDREMLRVDMRHILGLSVGFGSFSAELTDLAEVVVDAAYRLCLEELHAEHGEPRLVGGRPCPMSVCALGKCGGRELGYASDIELLFVYAGNGMTTGPRVFSSAEFYEKLVIAVIQAIRAKREGIFEIDVQLRPYGQAGSMAVSRGAFRRYFGPDGAAWPYERQALIKLRPIAGDPDLGLQLVAWRDRFVYGGARFDVAAMRAMRERQIRHLVAAGTINAKFSPGGLVDAEYLVQGLQINHGRDDPTLRLTNTHEALQALTAAGVLAPEDTEQLREAYSFLRQLIDALRMVRGSAKDLTVPSPESEEFAFLARRLGYAGDPARLRTDILRHTGAIQALSRRLLG